MRITRRVLINTIAFGVTSLILFAMLAVRILPTVFASSYTIAGVFSEAGGVFTDQEVTYRGVQVGRVGSMRLTNHAVKIDMIIQSRYKLPREGITARVLYKSAVGEQFIDLVPTHEGAPFMSEGDVIPLERTSIPVQTEDLLRELNSVLASLDPHALGSVVHELGTGLRNHGTDLKNILMALDTLTAIGATHQAEIATGIRSGASLQAAFNSTKEDFVSASGSLSTVSGVLAKRRTELEKTLDSTKILDAQILALLKDREAQINTIVADAGTLTRLTHAYLPDLDLSLEFLGPFFNDVYEAYQAPFFLFNLVQNGSGDGPACTYKGYNRPEKPINDTTHPDPSSTFNCDPEPAGANPPSHSYSSTLPIVKESVAPQTGPSWLRIYDQGQR
jgi:phospholipid/cholesterol/gamma-HCH transport system substrate-binding protein